MVRDEDFGTRQFRPAALYRTGSTPVDVPPDVAAVIAAVADRSPAAWTPRLVYEELRGAGHDGITEAQVNAVMAEIHKPVVRSVHPGDVVRAVRGRTGDQGVTGIVARRRFWRRVTVRWTSGDVTTVPIASIRVVIPVPKGMP